MQLTQSKIVYPLVILSFLVTGLFQWIWLRQLFFEQRTQLINDIESLVSKTAQQNVYHSLDADSTRPNNFETFLHSIGWLRIREGFDNVHADSSYKAFEITQTKDSSVVFMEFVFMKTQSPLLNVPYNSTTVGTSTLNLRDSLLLKQLRKRVQEELPNLGVFNGYYDIIHEYSINRDSVAQSQEAGTRADLITQTYSYNYDLKHKYQLVVTNIDPAVWYRMRYYIGSSLFMLLLTATAFVLIFKLVRNTRLYADARLAFTSNMTHEIKTPIATMALALESIKKYDLIHEPEKLDQYLDMGGQALGRLNQMTEKILTLSSAEKIYSAKSELFDVQPVISEVIDSMALLLEKSNTIYQFTASDEPCFIEGDQLHLSNVFYNLIENAIKYNPRQLSLQVKCTINNGRIIITFTDNGMGIAPIYHKKIFERFFRVPQLGSRHNATGSGLGLSYVKEVVSAHGGTITLHSEVGEGSTFTITLPSAVLDH